MKLILRVIHLLHGKHGEVTGGWQVECWIEYDGED